MAHDGAVRFRPCLGLQYGLSCGRTSSRSNEASRDSFGCVLFSHPSPPLRRCGVKRNCRCQSRCDFQFRVRSRKIRYAPFSHGVRLCFWLCGSHPSAQERKATACRCLSACCTFHIAWPQLVVDGSNLRSSGSAARARVQGLWRRRMMTSTQHGTGNMAPRRRRRPLWSVGAAPRSSSGHAASIDSWDARF